MAQLPPFASVLKSNDVEDLVNRYVHRTLAYLFVRSIFKTRITPNMITLSTVVVGFVAGSAFIWGTPTAMFVGGACLWAAAILDGADGILARAKDLQSEFGRALDGSADVLVAVFTVFPAFYHIWVTHHNPYHLALMVPALGLTVMHLAVYDFYKESYLRGTRPGQGGEGRDADDIDETVRSAKEKGPIVQMAVKYILVPHLQRQKAVLNWLNPDAWRLSQVLQSDDQTAEIYRKNNVWPMRLWALVSLAPHSYLMAMCAMLDRLDVYLYIRVFLMNGIFLVAILWQRHATCKTIEELAGVGAIKVSGTERSFTT
ncbi:MAG: CDP-alcohol phosphatidyltransferase family protein [Myxococcales bacterium]|nr:CDP-alcohol phosphatidyltransferase family protein [Myxococcales bacterium]MDH3844901.1 CDP-alcohol phosphatidyltransferase family protein [Myxococcales bacterium]